MAGSIDVRDVLLEAQAEVQEAFHEALQELMAPQMRELIMQQWFAMPAEMKLKFQTEQPDAYAALMEQMQGGEHD